MLHTTQSIEELAKTANIFSYDLPNMSTVITERKASGFLDEQKTGKITKKEVGVASVVQDFYFSEGNLIFVRVITEVESTPTQVKEFVFQNDLLVDAFDNGKKDEEVFKNESLAQYLTESNISESKMLFDDFVMRQGL